MSSPEFDPTSHHKQHKLLGGYSEEIIYQLQLAEEYIFHVGVEPRDGLLLQGGIPKTDAESKGTARPDLAPVEPVDVDRSLGVRLWPSCQQVVDDVYNEPLPNQWEFDPPFVTMGFVEFDEESSKQATVNEFGLMFSRDARMNVPVYFHLKNGLKYPKEGDVVEFWARSWHELGVFYDVVKSARKGFINDTSYFTNWVLELRRHDSFVPERRVLAALGESQPDWVSG